METQDDRIELAMEKLDEKDDKIREVIKMIDSLTWKNKLTSLDMEILVKANKKLKELL